MKPPGGFPGVALDSNPHAGALFRVLGGRDRSLAKATLEPHAEYEPHAETTHYSFTNIEKEPKKKLCKYPHLKKPSG